MSRRYEGPRAYEEARAEAQKRANSSGLDVAIRRVKEFGKDGFNVSFASKNDSDYARAEIVTPEGKMPKRYGRVDVTRHYKRRRLISPKACDRRSFRVKRVGRHGNFITVSCPNGQWSPRRKRCKVGMRAQSIAKKRRRR